MICENGVEVKRRYRIPIQHDGQEKVMEVGEYMHREIEKIVREHGQVDFQLLTNARMIPLKGRTFMERGYVWAPYKVVHRPVNVDYVQDLVPTKSVMTRYATKIINPGFYGKITFTDLGASSTNPCAEIELPIGPSPAVIADPAMYPHKCTRCGAPAYVGLMKVDCSRKSCC